MRKRIIIAGLIAVVHFAFTIISISKSDYIYGDEVARRNWQYALKILGSPILYVNLLPYHISIPKFLDFDWEPALVVLNSLFWGFVLMLVITWGAKRYRQKRS